MASVFANLFGEKAEGNGLFSSSNAFRRKTDDSVQKSDSGEAAQHLIPTDSAVDTGSEQKRQGKRARDSPKDHTVTDFLSIKKIKREGEEKLHSKQGSGNNAAKAARAGSDAVEPNGQGAHVSSGTTLTAAKSKKSSKEAAPVDEQAGPLRKRKKQKGDAGVVHDTLVNGGAGVGVEQPQEPSGKRQRTSKNSLPGKRADNKTHSDPMQLEPDGVTVGYNEGVGRLASEHEVAEKRREKEEVGMSSRRVTDGDDEPVVQPPKKKSKTPDDESDDEKRSKAVIERRQAAKHRKRSEADKLPRTIFVGNLPPTVKRKELQRQFAQYGAVESVRLRSLPLEESKLPRKAAVLAGKISDGNDSANAYVVFEDASSAEKARAHNMQEFLGRHVRVDLAAPVRNDGSGPPPVEYDRLVSVFVGNLPFDVQDEEVITAFSGPSAPSELHGAVEAVRVVRDKVSGQGKGIAYVMFKTKAASKVAIASPITIRGRALRLTRPGAKLRARTKQTTSSGKKRAPVAVGGKAGTRLPAAVESGTRQRGRASWEGAYAQKADGKPGKGGGRAGMAAPNRGSVAGKKVPPGKKSLVGGSEQPENRKRAGKRPAVAARKAKAAVPATGSKGGPGKTGISPGKKTTAGLTKAKKADKKKASKGMASFQVKGRKQ